MAGWRQWGEDVLPRLAGMFAFAMWDAEARTLTLARDRSGKKPLLYRRQGRRLSFASDLVALSRLDDTAGAVDMAVLRQYFALRFVPEPSSILTDVAKVPPGGLVRFGEGGAENVHWYRLAESRPPRYQDMATAADDLRAAVDIAVGERMVADVPLGAFLSGGVDSAVIVASMARQGGRVRTFTIGFEGVDDYYEERPAARAIADHFGTEHSEIAVSATMTRDLCDEVFDALDEPFADSSAVPTFIVARAARQAVTVALSGDGGDEILAGYRKYLGEAHAGRYRAVPAWLRHGLIEPLIGRLPSAKGSGWRERVRRLQRFVAHAAKDGPGRQAGWLRNLSEAELDALIVAPGGGATPEALIAELRAGAGDDDPLNVALYADLAFGLYADLAFGLPADMLVKVDRTSMANSLEVRCPLLDHRVVECAAAMPGSFKLAGGSQKRVLRTAFADRLPPGTFDRPKKGFEVPIADWLTGDLAELCRWAIDPGRLARQGLLRPALPARWFDDLKSGRRDSAWQLWTVVAFQAWWARHFEGAAG